MEKQKYPSINGLRAISIVLVLAHHLDQQNGIFKNLSGIICLEPFINFLKDGHLGVNVFFIVSGFLITSLMLQEEENTNTVSLKKFYIRRSLRIFPAYLFLLIVYSILQYFNFIRISNASWVTAITYTKYFNWQLDWYTAHIWSLSIEEQFYIFWPFLFITGGKIRKVIVISLILIVPVVRLYVYSNHIYWMNELTIFTRIDSIATGCFFALYKEDILKKINQNWTKLFYVSILSLFLLRYLPIIIEKINLAFIFIPLGLTHGTIANILIAMILMYSVFGPKGIWFKILNFKIINYIGVLSYSIYLWQQLFIHSTKYWVNHFPQNIFLMLFVAAFSYHLIEKPFLKFKSKFSVTTK